MAAHRSISSRTGATPLITCPVGKVEPVCNAFFSRSSTGSMPIAFASLSI
jgi:hypothetical protein